MNIFLRPGSLTRNSSTDLTNFKTRSDKKKVFDAMAAASIYANSAGVDTSRAKVLPLDALMQFLQDFQREENCEARAKRLIQVSGGYSGGGGGKLAT